MKENSLKILIVDDDDIFSRTMSAMLKSFSPQTYIASSGNEALKLLQSEYMDIVFSDVYMPNGSGIQLLESIKKYNINVPCFVLVTGYSMLSLEAVVAQGAHTILAKPFKRQDVLNIVNGYIGTRAVQ